MCELPYWGEGQLRAVCYNLKGVAVNNCKQRVSCNSFLLMAFAASKCHVNIDGIMSCVCFQQGKWITDHASKFILMFTTWRTACLHRVFKCDCQNSLLIFPTIISHWLLAGWCFKLSCYVLLLIFKPNWVISRGSLCPAISAFCQGV